MIDMNKKYTFGGQEGTVLTVTRNDKHFPVIWMDSDGSVRTFTSIGQYTANKDSLVKLIEVKPTRWVNLYPRGIDAACYHTTRAIADRYACSDRIACIEFTEGEGL